ncbi:hypothetical protein Pint_14435 [Pistacia integerrima]|uniref:Uncharacterized protein n=1 Tax=Pistacia integerrima TaxID=434235 RepID=A0ACC0Y8W6_9ROSI|nr:hypothetical protein Pint_14435 [Pistacia integerrima]
MDYTYSVTSLVRMLKWKLASAASEIKSVFGPEQTEQNDVTKPTFLNVTSLPSFASASGAVEFLVKSIAGSTATFTSKWLSRICFQGCKVHFHHFHWCLWKLDAHVHQFLEFCAPWLWLVFRLSININPINGVKEICTLE